MEAIEWKKKDKENFNLTINGVDMGVWNLSQMRHFIEVTDNVIDTYVPKL